MAAKTYPVPLTGGQLRVLHETLSVVLNDPDWGQTTATPPRDMLMLDRAAQTVYEAWRAAQKAESSPA